MEPKLEYNLETYTPGQVPQNPNEIPQYLQEELRKLAYPLARLSQTWAPQLQVGLRNPQAPTGLTTAPVTVAPWGQSFSTPYSEILGATADPVTGTVTFAGDGNTQLWISVSVNVALNVASYQNNNDITLSLSDGTTTIPISQSSKTTGSQTYMELQARRTFQVANNAVLSLLINGTSAGTIAYLYGDFTVSQGQAAT